MEIVQSLELISSVLFLLMTDAKGQLPIEDGDTLEDFRNGDLILGLAAGESEGDLKRHSPTVFCWKSKRAVLVVCRMFR